MAKWVLILVALSLNCAEQDFDYDNDQDVYNEYNYYDEGEGDMALNFSTLAELAGRHVPPDADYPYGSAQNETTEGADDGTPQIAKLRNDVQGFLQGLLQKAGIVPDGDPDIAAGQYREALDTMPISLTQLADGSTIITSGNQLLTINVNTIAIANTSTGAQTVLSSNALSQIAPDGDTYSLISDLFNGGTRYTGTTPGTAVTTRRNSFVNPFASVTVTDNLMTINDQVVLTGVPVGATIHNVGVYYTRDAVPARRVYVPMTCEFSYDSTWLTVEKMLGTITAAGVPTITGDVVMYIDYDPSLVN
jgi:hypothetical protein